MWFSPNRLQFTIQFVGSRSQLCQAFYLRTCLIWNTVYGKTTLLEISLTSFAHGHDEFFWSVKNIGRKFVFVLS